MQAEKERHDALDHIVLLARRDELHRAPLVPLGEDYPQLRVLDVGCGTGIWAINMAEYVFVFGALSPSFIFRLTKLHPAVNTPWQRYGLDPHGSMTRLKAVQVIGIDLSKIQPDAFVHHISNSRLETR